MRHKEIIDRMTLEEKAAFLQGKGEWITRNIDRLGIPSIFLSDGPSGLRKQAGAGDHLGINPSVPATCFPSAATIANSWDEALAEKVGEGLGAEAMAEGVQVLLGPGLNIKRNPLCGRNFEYYSEDPYLAGKLAAACIRGIQSRGAGACAKHLAVNSQEERRMAMNAVIDERTLREIYLTGFEIAIKEGKPVSVMSSYNEINGVYANENKHLLKDILRDEWGFEGFVVTDWGASNDHALGVRNGSALEMPAPGLDSARELIVACNSGKINVEDIDERVSELLDAVLALDENAKAYRDKNGEPDREMLHNENHELARLAAEESAVLLKNRDNLLPINTSLSVAIIGDFAYTPRYQGAGSSMVNSTRVDSIEKLVERYDIKLAGTARGYRRDGRKDAAMVKEAVDLAAKADVVLYFFGLNEKSESEGLDRKHLRIPQNQITLLQELAQVNGNLVGVLSAGSVIEMPWHHHLKAILHGYLTGQAGAEAILNILTGKVNPSGKLAETYLRRYEDTPSYSYYPARERNSEYREGLFVGYRYFDTAQVPVAYPFGFGLSYTSFEYKDVSLEDDGVAFTITNTGNKDGAEIAELYVSLPDAKVFRPAKELKGFVKVYIKAGEEKRVKILFDDKTFRYWDRKTGKWEIEGGNYKIMIGASSVDIRLTVDKYVEGTVQESPYEADKIPSYYSGRVASVTNAEYEELLGQKIPDGSWGGELDVNDALCQLYYSRSALGRAVYRHLNGKIRKAEEAGELPDLNTLFQYNMPFRAIAKMTGGVVSMEMARGLTDVVNGHFFKGMGKVIGGYFRNKRENKRSEKRLNI